MHSKEHVFLNESLCYAAALQIPRSIDTKIERHASMGYGCLTKLQH